MRRFVNRGSASHQQRTARRSSPTIHSKALMGGPRADGHDGQDRVATFSIPANGGGADRHAPRRRGFSGLYFRLFRHLQGVVDLNSKIPHGAFQSMARGP
jgi:hypothetical protein